MPKKIRVAIFHCGFIYSGGGERIVLEEAKGLIRKGYEVEIFGPTLDPKLCFPEEVRNLGVRTFLPQLPSFIPARHAFTMLASAILAPFFALRFKDVDIFLGANQPGAWIAYCVAKTLRKPYFVYMNQPNRLLYHREIDEEVNWQNLKEYYFIDDLIKMLRPVVCYIDRISFTKGKTILVNGTYIGDIIRKIYKAEVDNCPAGAFVQKKSDIRSSRKSIYQGDFKVKNLEGKDFSIKKPYIFLTNRHVPQKRFEYAIKALPFVVKKFPDISLVVPGPFTSYTNELKKLAKSLNVFQNIIFPGQISEGLLQKLYQESAVYVYTSPEEDFGMGIIEAMGWGVPVVAWNHAGPTVTVVNNKTGYLAKPYSVEDFAKKIVSVISDKNKRVELGKNAWEHVKKNFSWQKHVDILEKAIKQEIN